MNYIVVIYNKSYPFSSYSEALLFKQKNGGSIYIKACSCEYRR